MTIRSRLIGILSWAVPLDIALGHAGVMTCCRSLKTGQEIAFLLTEK